MLLGRVAPVGALLRLYPGRQVGSLSQPLAIPLLGILPEALPDRFRPLIGPKAQALSRLLASLLVIVLHRVAHIALWPVVASVDLRVFLVLGGRHGVLRVVLRQLVHRHQFVALELPREGVGGGGAGGVLGSTVLLIVATDVEGLVVAPGKRLLGGHVALALLVHLHVLHLLAGLKHVLVLGGAVLDAVIEVLWRLTLAVLVQVIVSDRHLKVSGRDGIFVD